MSDTEQAYVQADQPDGVPPLELTGERTLPDVPEENYWYRRHLAVYEWIAERCRGLRVVDLACGEGYGSDLLARHADEVIGVDANPEAHEHARARYRRGNLSFQRGLVEDFDEPVDAVVFLQTIEHIHEPGRLLARIAEIAPVAYISTPNRLTLAPPGAEKSDNPWHLRSTTRASTGSCSSRTSRASRSSASSTPASCERTSSRSSSAGTASIPPCTSPSRSTTASSRRSAPGTSACRPATSTGRWTSSAICEGAP